MASSKRSSILKKYMAELEVLKEKKRVLEESEPHHITKRGSKKPGPSKKAVVKKTSVKKKRSAAPKKSRSVAKKAAAPKKPKKAPLQKKPKQKKMLPKKKPKEETKTAEEQADEEEISDEEIQNFQVGKANMEHLINRVCEILAKNQSEGVFQSEVWRRLKLTVRDGFRLALKLEWLGIISREKVLEKGRWTYKLLLKRTPISTRSIIQAPCLTCPVEQKCTPDGEVSPYTCDLIRDWVIVEAKRLRKLG